MVWKLLIVFDILTSYFLLQNPPDLIAYSLPNVILLINILR